MRLKDIIRNCGVVSCNGSTELEIGAVCNDSRKVVPGSLFVAVNGCGNDGREYIGKAMEAGAAAIMYEETPDMVWPDGEVTRIIVKDSREGQSVTKK